MNQTFDIRYLEDPKDSMGETNDPAEVSTIVSEDLREEAPAAHALVDALELTEAQINGLEQAINEEEDPLAGSRRWVSENRGVVGPWIEAARNAGELPSTSSGRSSGNAPSETVWKRAEGFSTGCFRR